MIKDLCTEDGKIKVSVYILLIILPLISALLAVNLGRMEISLGDFYHFIKAYIAGSPVDPALESVIINIRLPRTLAAMIVGSGLACAGLAFQALFSNPLATPDVLGVSSASSVGAIIGILWSLDTLGIQLLALGTGLISVFITLNLSKNREDGSVIMLILAGLIMSSLSNALASLLKYTADPMDKLPEITYWLMGSFARASYKNIILVGPLIIAGIIIIYINRWRLNILSLSEDEARSLGINIKATRMLVILSSSLITASSVALCGQIGWVGLIIPHICRMLVGANNYLIFPFAMSFGAVFMVVIEALSRSISVIELPISILTAIIGAPVFILLLRQTGGEFR